MTNTRSRIAATLALAAITATSACATNDPQPSLSSPTSATSSATTPTASAASVSLAEQDSKDAAGTITRFWVVLDELASDPQMSRISSPRSRATRPWRSGAAT